jgi:hypothetical protein
MEELISFQGNLLQVVSDKWFRYLYRDLWDDQRLLGIKGLRGTGKTTLLLQYLKYRHRNIGTGLYVTLDHPYFYRHNLFDLAGDWYQYGGELLLIDEIHKYPNWSRELKLMYDGFPNLKIFFTASSALDLFRGESDLSRRLLTQNLHGLSFREYLSLIHGFHFEVIALEHLLTNAAEHAESITREMKPLPLFRDYLKTGYFPFSKTEEADKLQYKLIQIINTVLESDLAYVQNYNASNINNLKKLLGVIASSAPFQPNISNIARKLTMGRETINQYLKHLDDAHILMLAHRTGKGSSTLQKPDKIYIENTNFAFALKNTPEVGAIRETFFINQLRNCGHEVEIAKKGDFLIDNKWLIEVGGKSKDGKQIANAENAFLAVDETETAFGNKIPLWLFGFLY